jgi:undecaprenyl-diphosphatase
VAAAVAVLGLVLVRLGRGPEAVRVAFVAFSGGILVWGMKLGIARVRPPASEALIALPDSGSMPSGHAFGAAMLGVLVVAAVRGHTRRRALLVGLCVSYVLIIGLSRIYLGVHWAGDTLAGWALGSLWGMLYPVWRGRFTSPGAG